MVLETVSTSDTPGYDGAFFYSLAPKVQLATLEMLRREILMEDCIGMYYHTALNFELTKYMEFLKKCIKAYIDNFDPGLMDRRMNL